MIRKKLRVIHNESDPLMGNILPCSLEYSWVNIQQKEQQKHVNERKKNAPAEAGASLLV